MKAASVIVKSYAETSAAVWCWGDRNQNLRLNKLEGFGKHSRPSVGIPETTHLRSKTENRASPNKV